MNKISILIVEADPHTIRFYKSIFGVSQDWEVIFCKRFGEGLEQLKEKQFDYVIAEGVIEDSSMTGIDFLREVSDYHPETVRLLISSNIVPNSEEIAEFIFGGLFPKIRI